MMRYVTYKDTEIDWLGKIPATWNVERIKSIGSVNGRVGWKALKAAEYVESGFFFLSTPNIKEVEIDFVNVNYITAERYYESPEIMLEVGDILLVKDGSTLGIVNVIRCLPAKGTVNSSIAVLRIKKFHSVYGYYFLLSNYIQNVIQLKKDGMGVPHLFQKDINNFEILVPSLEEQTAIANYLDTKTQAIDKKVSLLAKKIGHYQELRKSLIHETVTRGLDKNVKLKESGIDWIGQIPEHWEVKRLKDIVSTMGCGSTPTTSMSSFYENGTINWLNTGDLNDGYVSQTKHMISPEALDAYPSMKIFKKGTLVFALYGATIGKLGLLEIETTTNQACCCMSFPYTRINPKYIFNWFLANKENIISLSVGGTQPNVSQGILSFLKITIPPLSEQTQITDYLAEKTSKIAKIITNLQTQITTLKELRKTLINDVVTGKIKVTQG